MNAFEIRAIRDALFTAVARRSEHGVVPCYLCRRLIVREAAALCHKVPIRRGGDWERANLMLACVACAHAKGGRTLDEYRAAQRDLAAQIASAQTAAARADMNVRAV